MKSAFLLKSAPYATVAMLAVFVAGCELNPFTNQAANRQMAEAQRYLDRGLPDSALAAFGLALEENPKITEAHMGMGNIYRGWGNYRLASRAYERAVKMEPNNFDANYALGEMYHLLGEFEKAVTVFLRALTIEPRHFGANDQLAQVYLQLDQPGQALTYARRATIVDPTSQDAWTKLGMAYNRTEQYEQAIDAFRKAAEMGDIDEDILLGLSVAHIKLENYDRALNTLSHLITMRPSALAFERQGYALFKTRQYGPAMASFQSALNIDPNDTSALNGAGVCSMTTYILEGRRNPELHSAAFAFWKRSISINPDQPHILDLMSRYQLK